MSFENCKKFMDNITTVAGYLKADAEIKELLHKGSFELSEFEKERLNDLHAAVHLFEKEKHTVGMPATLPGMIKLRMYELKMNNLSLAGKLNLSPVKVSMILRGKQRPDVDFLKAIHRELDIDASFILTHA